MKRFAFFSLLALLLSCNKIEQPRFPAVGDSLPEFSVTTNKGILVNTQILSQGNSLIVFFNTLCKDCQQELPVLQEFYNETSNDVRTILISREEVNASIEKYWKENSLTLPYSPQESREVFNLFSNVGIPLCVLSKNGIIIKVYNQYLDKTMPSLQELKKDFGL